MRVVGAPGGSSEGSGGRAARAVMPVHWVLLVAWAGAASAAATSGNFSLLAEVTVSSQAVRVRGGETVQQEKAHVRPIPRRLSRAADPEQKHSSDDLSDEENSTQTVSTDDTKLSNASTSTQNTTDIQTTDQPQGIGITDIISDLIDYVLPEDDPNEGRGHMKKMKKMFKKISPYLMVPGFMALGYAPFALASLKMFVMNALMINMMGFNAAIFLTLRNIVFGPRRGEHIKYYNFGYKKRPHHHHPHPHG